jgi:hypothetical protein
MGGRMSSRGHKHNCSFTSLHASRVLGEQIYTGNRHDG